MYSGGLACFEPALVGDEKLCTFSGVGSGRCGGRFRMAVPGRWEDRMMSTDDNGGDQPRTITASEFRAKCLALMDEVADTGEEIVITKRGVPVVRLVPYRKRSATFYGRYKGLIKIHGDLDEPVMDDDWEEEWLKKWDERLVSPD